MNNFYNNELYHYGIMGMKWGVRRYQNPDGSLTAEGKKRAKQEYKEDNKTAYELGKKATIYGNAAVKAMNKAAKAQAKVDKTADTDPAGLKKSTQRKIEKATIAMDAAVSIAQKAGQYRKEAEEHCKSLVDKYGEEAVSQIKYKDLKVSKDVTNYSGRTSIQAVNERTTSGLEIAAAVGVTAVSAALTATLKLPVTMIYYPEGTGTKADRVVAEETARAKQQRSRQSNLGG